MALGPFGKKWVQLRTLQISFFGTPYLYLKSQDALSNLPLLQVKLHFMKRNDSLKFLPNLRYNADMSTVWLGIRLVHNWCNPVCNWAKSHFQHEFILFPIFF